MEEQSPPFHGHERFYYSNHIWHAATWPGVHHSELLNSQNVRLQDLAPTIEAFQLALEELDLQDSVLSFTASDFARTLISNGVGSDHAWGGNQMVFGGPVNGGQVLGQFPELTNTGAHTLDGGRIGRLLPSTSVDEFVAELLLWFGIDGESNFETVLPNLSYFFDVKNVKPDDPSTFPIGFLKPNTF